MTNFVSETRADIGYAFRTLVKSPGFAAVAVLGIALGVGPNSAVFSIIHAVLLRPLPLGESERVVMMWETNKARGLDQIGVSGPSLLDWQRDAHSFTSLMPAQGSPELGFNLTAGGEPERVLGGRVGANFSDVLGVTPVAGRGFLPEEARPGAAKVALLSYQLWQRRFGANPAIIGRPIGLDGISYTVVGVLPADLRSIGSVDVWVPIADDLAHLPRGDHRYGVLARLKPGVTVAQAQAEMNDVTARLARQYPDTNSGVGAVLIPVNSIFGAVRSAFAVLFGAVLFLLLMACANVAGLLLARGAARGKEIAVRAALGASTGRIVRQLLAESAVLALLGGALGLLLASWSIAALRSALPDVIPRLKEMGINAAVLVFTLAASMLTGVLFGVFPAVRTARAGISEVLKEGGGKGVAGSNQGTRSALLVGEVALAVMLLAAAGLLIHSFVNLTSVDPGFRAANLLTMRLTLPQSKYADPMRRAAFTRSVLRRVEALPGVRAASTISILPMRTYFLNLPANLRPYHIEGQPSVPRAEEPSAEYRIVNRGFVPAMGIRLLRGRDFNEHDKEDVPRVVLVNEALARRCCPGEDVIRKQIRMEGRVREIVGVIPDVRLAGLDTVVRPAVFVPHDQEPTMGFSLLVRTASDPAALSGAVRREVLAEDAQQPVSDVRTMEQVVGDSLLLRRLSMSLLAIFAALALLLAGIGIYGMIAYSVSRRTQEIGLRMALGAGRKEILRLVVGRGLAVGVTGVAIGVPAAFAVTRLMRGLLFGVNVFDPVVFVCVPLLLLLIAALASYFPARRAMRVDPVMALRYE
jgi:putative ABC transport system permease protein